MVKVYTLEHFQKLEQRKLLGKIVDSDYFNFLTFSNGEWKKVSHYPSPRPILRANKDTLEDGRRLLMECKLYELIQKPQKDSREDIFNFKTIKEQFYHITGENSSSLHRYKNRFLLKWDNLTEEGKEKHVRVTRTDITIRPSSFLDDVIY